MKAKTICEGGSVILCSDEDCKICFKRSFASHPRSEFWSVKNVLNPRQVTRSTKGKFIFDCLVCKHEVEMTLASVIIGNNCIYCARKKLCSDIECEFCWNNSFASNPKSQFWSSKNIITPRQVLKASRRSFIFDCFVCEHEVELVLGYVHLGRWCNICARMAFCSNKECYFCWNNSFASDPKSEYWSNKNILSPREVQKTTGISYYFNCNICQHEFKISLNSIRYRDSWCPYCRMHRLCSDKDCLFCWNNSFASKPNSKYWNKKNLITPRNISKHSNEEYIFDCWTCQHSFLCKINSRKNVICPYCNYELRLCNESDCKTCHENSVSGSFLSKIWSYDHNKENPRSVHQLSKQIYYFKCQNCNNIFKSRVCDLSKGISVCKCLRRKTETKLYNFLKEHFKDIEREKAFYWSKRCKFDFFIPSLFLFIEQDGIQHFKTLPMWEDYKKTQKRDLFKLENAILNGYSIIRVYQLDIHEDRFDWKESLLSTIRSYEKPQQIVLSKIYLVNNPNDSMIYICNHISFFVKYYINNRSHLYVSLLEIDIDPSKLSNERSQDFDSELSKLITKCYNEETRREIFLHLFHKVNRYISSGKENLRSAEEGIEIANDLQEINPKILTCFIDNVLRIIKQIDNT